MTDKRCSDCCMLFPEKELVIREDDGRMVCPACSGLNEEEERLLACAYDEEG